MNNIFNRQPQPQPQLMDYGELRQYYRQEAPATPNGEWQPAIDPVFEVTSRMHPADRDKYIKSLAKQTLQMQMGLREQGLPADIVLTSDGVPRRAFSAPRQAAGSHRTPRVRSNSYQVVNNNGNRHIKMQYGQKKALIEQAKEQGRQEFIEDVKYKAKVTALGIVALLGVGAGAYRPALEAYTKTTHFVATAYENRVLKPIDDAKRVTTETIGKVTNSPVVKFTNGIIEKVTEEPELKSPIPDDEWDRIKNEEREDAKPKAEEVPAKMESDSKTPDVPETKVTKSETAEKTAETVSDSQIPPFKYEEAIDKAVKETGTSRKEFHLLRMSENAGENLLAVNHNNNGTVDVSLFQDNVKPTDTKEIERLQSDPAYAAWKAGMKMQNRRKWLHDPNLAIAAYNLGPSGAANNPEAALNRAKFVYDRAGMEMPETEFTRNPYKFVEKHWDDFKNAGLQVAENPPAAPDKAKKL